MNWILVLVLLSPGAGVHGSSIEFRTEGACEYAAAMLKNSNGVSKAFCVRNEMR